jgi:hypothetical protein
LEFCPECGVPQQVSTTRTWSNNGDIVQTGNETHRACFIETESLDPIYASLSTLLGLPIDRFVIDLAGKGNGDYVRAITPPNIMEMLKEGTLPADSLMGAMHVVAGLSGYGKYELVGFRNEGDKDDYITIRVTDPYSLLLVCGSVKGTIEVIAERPGYSGACTWEETGPDTYEITIRTGAQEKVLDEHFHIEKYRHQDGDIELERCPACFAPFALREYKWDADTGIIRNNRTGRRMALVGPYVLDPLFRELEKELGENITAMTVEAQRRYIRDGMYSIDEISDQGDFQTQLALRGFGNLREMKISNNGLQMRIANAANYLLTAGMAQGLFEAGFGVDSVIDWGLSDEGVLEVDIIPKRST